MHNIESDDSDDNEDTGDLVILDSDDSISDSGRLITIFSIILYL